MTRRTRTILAAALAILLIWSACGGGGDLGPSVIGAPGEDISRPTSVAFATVVILDPEARPIPSSIDIMPAQVTLTPGQTVIMNAVIYDAAGTPLRDVELLWQMKDPRAGTVDEAGILVAGSAPGLYPKAVEVVATQESGAPTLSAAATVNIIDDTVPLLLHSVGVYPSNITVLKTQFTGLGALGWDAQGRFVPGLQFKWSMDDPAAGFIDDLGFFTAGEEPGSYPNSIRVTAIQSMPQGEVARVGFVSVTVVEEAGSGLLTNVEITPDRVYLEPGKEVVFLAHAFDAGGRPLDNISFEWSFETSVAGSIDADGRLTAGSVLGWFPDRVRVIATQTLPDRTVRAEGRATVFVIAPKAERIMSSAHILPSSVALNPGQRFAFIGVIFDEYGKQIVGVNTEWEVLDPRSGSIDPFGIMTAGGTPGMFPDAVRVQVVHGEGPDPRVEVAYATVGIIGELERSEIQPRRLMLRPGQTFLLSAKGYDANGLAISTARSTWSMVDPAAGTINASGLFTAGDQPGTYVNAIKVVTTESGD